MRGFLVALYLVAVAVSASDQLMLAPIKYDDLKRPRCHVYLSSGTVDGPIVSFDGLLLSVERYSSSFLLWFANVVRPNAVFNIVTSKPIPAEHFSLQP